MGNPAVKEQVTEKIIIEANQFHTLKEAVERNKRRLSMANLENANLIGANLRKATLTSASLEGANLRGADLTEADLRHSNLSWADLTGAKLIKANLEGAFLTGTKLVGADLSYANLKSARIKTINIIGTKTEGAIVDEPIFLPNLYMLKLQNPDTPIRAWKYLINGRCPNDRISYRVGEEYRFDNCNYDETIAYDKSGNVTTLPRCLNNEPNANEFIEVEFYVKDIVAVPFIDCDFFRVKRFKVLRKINREEAVNLLKKIIEGGIAC